MQRNKPWLAKALSPAFLVWCCFAYSSAHAQTVSVDSSTPDTVGQRLVFSVKERIRKAAGMTFVVGDSGYQLKIVTLDPDPSVPGNRTIYAVTVTMQPIDNKGLPWYLTNIVGLCGTAAVDRCAEGIVAQLDDQITQVRAAMAGASK